MNSSELKMVNIVKIKITKLISKIDCHKYKIILIQIR